MPRLELDRPLVCFDLETTGTDVKTDRIVQIALVRLTPARERFPFCSLVNPERPIPPGATKVHGITDADVASAPRLVELADDIHACFEGADLAGFNSIRFDLPLLLNELARVGRPLDVAGRRHLDACRIFHQMEPRTLGAALRFYCGRELEGAHDALADTEATLDVLEAQVERYDELPADVDALARFCAPGGGRGVDPEGKLLWNDEGHVVLSFGKYRNRPLAELALEDPGYLNWVVSADFSDEVKQIIVLALDGRAPRREAGAPAAEADDD